MTLTPLVVRPADLRAGAPIDGRYRSILNKQALWLCNTWPEPTTFPNTEASIRGAGSAAFALAVTIQTQQWDADLSGLPDYRVPRDRANRLIAGLVANHRSTKAGGWGGTWQSALWATIAGAAGWLHWGYLSTATRESVAAMLADEANTRLGIAPEYYRDADGYVLTPGDTKAEENAWNATVLALARVVMPEHPSAALWEVHACKLAASAYAVPADVGSVQLLNGRTLSEWVGPGSNAEPDHTVINHSRNHVDYVAAGVNLLGTIPLLYALAGEACPRAMLHNAAESYTVLTDRLFTAPPWEEPGGTVYKPGLGAVYYPAVNDWGTRRSPQWTSADAQAAVLGLDIGCSRSAGYWESLHGEDVRVMQTRGTSGQVFYVASEETYNIREQWAAYLMALGWLTHWAGVNVGIRLHDGPVG